MFRSFVIIVASVASIAFASPQGLTWCSGIPSQVTIVRCKPMGAYVGDGTNYSNTSGAPVMFVQLTNIYWGFFLLDTPDSWNIYNAIIAAKNANKSVTLGYSTSGPSQHLVYTGMDGVLYILAIGGATQVAYPMVLFTALQQ